MHFVEQTHVPEILREAGPEGLSTKDIATKIAELRATTPGAKEVDIDPSKIGMSSRYATCNPRGYSSFRAGHILRVLATYHWVREVRPDVFANNRLTSFIDSGKSLEQLKLA